MLFEALTAYAGKAIFDAVSAHQDQKKWRESKPQRENTARENARIRQRIFDELLTAKVAEIKSSDPRTSEFASKTIERLGRTKIQESLSALFDQYYSRGRKLYLRYNKWRQKFQTEEKIRKEWNAHSVLRDYALRYLELKKAGNLNDVDRLRMLDLANKLGLADNGVQFVEAIVNQAIDENYDIVGLFGEYPKDGSDDQLQEAVDLAVYAVVMRDWKTAGVIDGNISDSGERAIRNEAKWLLERDNATIDHDY